MYCETCNADDPPHAPGCRAPDGELHRVYRDAEEIWKAATLGFAEGHSSKLSAIAALAERIKHRCLWEIAARPAGREAERLRRISEIIEQVDVRCMASDGPVPPTLSEMTQAEISEIYELANGSPAA